MGTSLGGIMTAAYGQDTTPLTHGDVVILDYLAALWAESEDLSPDLRDELMTTVTEYVARRRTAVSDPIADPQQIIGRLGPPEALVQAARRGHLPHHLRLPVPVTPPRDPPAPAPGPVEYWAVALLTGGAFVLPVVGPLAGMLLASGSSRWTPSQKALAWVLTAGSAGVSAMLLLLAAAFGSGAGVAVAFVAMVAGPAIAGARLIPPLSRHDG
jgi:hypothetical protein